MYNFVSRVIQLMHDFQFAITAGTENDLNYFEIPIDLNVETSVNEIEGRHSTDESVRMKTKRVHTNKFLQWKFRHFGTNHTHNLINTII